MGVEGRNKDVRDPGRCSPLFNWIPGLVVAFNQSNRIPALIQLMDVARYSSRETFKRLYFSDGYSEKMFLE